MLRRLRPLDRVLLFTLVPLWLVCAALTLREIDRTGLPAVPIDVMGAASSADYPIVVGKSPWAPAFSERDEPSAGDGLLRLGEEDLRGVTRLGALARLLEAAGEGPVVPLVVLRAGHEIEVSLRLSPTFRGPWLPLIVPLATVLCSISLLLRAPQILQVQSLFPVAIAVCLSMTPRLGGPRELTYFWFAVLVPSAVLLMPLSLRFALSFPPGVPAQAARGRVWPWVLSVFYASSLACFWLDAPVPRPVVLTMWLASIAVWGVTFLALLTRNYLRADAIGRRQARWVLLGFYLGVTPGLATFVAVHLGSALGHELASWLSYFIPAVSLAFLAVPVGFLVAILRYDLFDIDRLISSTASYSVLAVMVLAGAFALVPRLADAASTAAGVDPSSAQIFLSIALAAVAIPAHRALRPRIDRVLFPERHALEEGMQQLLGEIAGERDARRLTSLVGERLDALLRPESCVVYAGGEAGYGPIFTRGRAVPPAFDPRSPLVATLERRPGPLVSERFVRRGGGAELSLFDRAALDTLGVAVIVPVRRRGQLTAFLCLGRKRSGDIYTPTDVALIMAVAGSVSTQLDRLEDAEIARASRAMQQELRRFVPGAVAKELEAGADLEPRERSVSVLFVDLRGYTAYSESRRARDVFSTVNRYTHAVSAIVKKLGGSVVEFSGDGMMAVFGAPTALADKEGAAVAAGREMVAEVQGLGGPRR